MYNCDISLDWSFTTTALKTGNDKACQLNSRRRGGILASAAKLFLMAGPFRTRLVSERIWFVIGLDQRRPRSTPSSPEQSQTLFCLAPAKSLGPCRHQTKERPKLNSTKIRVFLTILVCRGDEFSIDQGICLKLVNTAQIKSSTLVSKAA